MAFMAKILSWRFRHRNIVGCLLKRRPNKGGSRAPQDPPLATPLVKIKSVNVPLSRDAFSRSHGYDNFVVALGPYMIQH